MAEPNPNRLDLLPMPTPPAIRHRVNASSAVPILGIGIVALAAGFWHGNAASATLGVLWIAAPLAVRLLLGFVASRLKVSRLAPDTAYEGDRVEVHIRIENPTRIPVFFPEVSEIFSPEIHAQKNVLFPQRLDAGETLEQSYSGDCLLPRGEYIVGPAAISVSDPFGWFVVRRDLSVSRTIKVYPRVHDLRTRDELGECIALITDRFTRPRLGESNEFLSVREYRIGDALRRVHWRLSAHRGYPVVREFTRPSRGELTVFVDTFQSARLGVGRTSSLEYGVKLAASLAARALRRGHRVRVVAAKAQHDDVEPSAEAGRFNVAEAESSHFTAVLDLLVAVRPKGQVPLTTLLKACTRNTAPGSTVVVPVSPYLYTDESFLAWLSATRRRTVQVIAVVFDASTFQTIWNPLTSQSEIDTPEFVTRLRAMGVECFVLPCGGELSRVLRNEAAL